MICFDTDVHWDNKRFFEIIVLRENSALVFIFFNNKGILKTF